MAKSQPKHLRLHVVEEIAPRPSFDPAELPAIDKICEAVARLTGGSLRYAPGARLIRGRDTLASYPVRSAAGEQLGELVLTRGCGPGDQTAQDAAEVVAGVAELLSDLFAAQDALWRREAELAACVPVMPQRHEGVHLAARLQAILESGVRAVGCQAAAIYLLDADTSVLKLRSSFGLPSSRLREPARPLTGALGDLEALLGSAVVLSDPEQFELWKAPEKFATAICLPISSPTSPLGTAWFFASAARDFNDRESELLEIVVGRIAAELDRHALLADGVSGNELRQQAGQLARLQLAQLPHRPPLVDDWDTAGATIGGDEPLVTFHDWLPLADDRIGFLLGSTDIGSATEAGGGLLHAAECLVLRATLRALATSHADPGAILSLANRSLWTTSAGDQQAAALAVVVRGGSADAQVVSAGEFQLFAISSDGSWRSHSRSALPLGNDIDTVYLSETIRIEPGQVVVAHTSGMGLPEDALFDIVGGGRTDRARGLVETICGRVNEAAASERAARGSLLILKRSDRTR